ncbi:MAG TPA: UDP-N-acetylenolpyruvoylglucosamine reductase, partial [Verrucomicrobia bacterium]|nr:UDP-N-acetylenolpyruvoylglucosamine reductase [Verrucomicrobiota bacterium]
EWDAEALAAAQAGNAAEYLARRKKFPPRCCGSVFKNPPGDFAGRLLEAVGAKRLRVGGAYVWEGHANVVAAEDGANSSDILALARLLRLRVKERFGIELEPEIQGLAVT